MSHAKMPFSAIGMIYMKWDVMSEFFNRDTISWVLISACLAFISGQVWNSIRGPQYLMRARGKPHQSLASRLTIILQVAVLVSSILHLSIS